jgi:hypothetical protein
MQKMLFASLLTIAVVFAQATGGSDNKSGTAIPKKKGGKKSTGVNPWRETQS